MATVNLSIFAGAGAQFFDNNGVILSGGKLYTYLAGSTTPATTYTDNLGATTNANPIILDSAGRTPNEIWLAIGTSYKFILKTSTDVLIGTYDNISGANDISQLSDTTNVALGDALVGFKQYKLDNVSAYSNAVGSTVHNKLTEFLSIRDFGAVCDGSTDDTTAVTNAIANIGASTVKLVIPGPTKITSAVTFLPGTTLVFPAGGYFVGIGGGVGSGPVVTVQSQIEAGRTTVFSNCDPYSSVPQTLYPEWFGAKNDDNTDCAPGMLAAVRMTRNVGGIMYLEAGSYKVYSTVNFNTNKFTVQGAGKNASFIKASSTSVYPVYIVGASNVAKVANVALRDFSIWVDTDTTTTAGLVLRQTADCLVENMQINGFIIGLSMFGATNTELHSVRATQTSVKTGFIGFDITSAASESDPDLGQNASSIFRDCQASSNDQSVNSTGFKVSGAYMSDLQFQNCETASTSYGFYLDYTSTTNYNMDIIIQNPIIDRFNAYGIAVIGLGTLGSLSIYGGYSNANTVTYATGNPQNVRLYQCFGRVSVTNHQFMCPTSYQLSPGVYAFYAESSTSFVVANNVFYEPYYGARLVSCLYAQVTGNVFKNSVHAARFMVYATGCQRVMISNNAFSGLATNVVGIDATSTNCGIIGNVCDTGMGAPLYSNAGSTPVGGADGSTGLNAGY